MALITSKDCLYINNCSLKNVRCGEYCLRFTRIQSLLNYSGLPKCFCKVPEFIKKRTFGKDERVSNKLLKIHDNIYEWVRSGNNLYLYSSICGNGKSSWAAYLMLSYFQHLWLNNYNCAVCRGKFVNVFEFFDLNKRSFSIADENFNNYLQELKTCDLVIWDDLGTNLGNFDITTLSSILTVRLQNGLANIYTSNLDDRDMLRAGIDDRFVSRVCNASTMYCLQESDKRGEL